MDKKRFNVLGVTLGDSVRDNSASTKKVNVFGIHFFSSELDNPSMPKKDTHNFKGFDDRIALFRTGDHISSSGQSVSISDDDLNQMVSNFDANDSFPVVIGHPTEDAPAYGWAESVEVDDGVLYAKFTDMNSEFVAGVESGAYRNRSISIDKNDREEWTIRHLGFLGAAAPAIKGLKKMEFSDSATALNFAIDEDKLVSATNSAGWALSGVGGMLRKIKNWIIDKNSLEEADELLPEYALEEFNRAGEKLRDIEHRNQGHMYSAPQLQSTHTITDDNGGDPMPEPKKPAANFSQADIDTARDQAREEARAEFAHQTDCDKFVAQLETDGKITPAMKAGVGLASFLAALPHGEQSATFNFSAADGKTEETATPYEFAKKWLESLPANFAHLTAGAIVTDDNAPDATQASNFSAPDGYAVDSESTELHNKAVDFQAKDSNLTYLDAVKKAQADNS